MRDMRRQERGSRAWWVYTHIAMGEGARVAARGHMQPEMDAQISKWTGLDGTGGPHKQQTNANGCTLPWYPSSNTPVLI